MSVCSNTDSLLQAAGCTCSVITASNRRAIVARVKDYAPSHCFLMMNPTQLITPAFSLHVLFSEFFLLARVALFCRV